jgi:hypothetical protein
MTGIDVTLRTLHRGERELADELRTAADRHRAEHEVHHVAIDIARWSREHAERIEGVAPDYGVRLAESAAGDSGQAVGDADAGPAVLPALRDQVEAIGRSPVPGLRLLHDLRVLYLGASENSLGWEMLAQAAQAQRETRLLELASACHPQTLRQVRWANTLIKTLSPQVLSSM